MLKTYQVQLKSNQGVPNHRGRRAITPRPLSLPRKSAGTLLVERGLIRDLIGCQGKPITYPWWEQRWREWGYSMVFVV
jgi:hypothetical protein